MKKVLFFALLLFVTVFGFSNSSFAIEQSGEFLPKKEIIEKDVFEEILEPIDSEVQPMWNMPVPKTGDKNFKMIKGDILISNSTSSAGLTGHAGIAINETQVLHIVGAGHKPSVMSLSTWINRYGTGKTPGKTATWVYRVSNRTAAIQAGNWAIDNYRGKSYSYGITTTLSSKNPTYCSKIVWQAYRYGPSSSYVNSPPSLIVRPYELPAYFKSGYKPKYLTAI